MKAVVVGAGGQLGRELLRCRPARHQCVALPRRELDVTDRGEVARLLRWHRPAAIFNCAAYTDVDAAESEPDLALAVNAEGVANLAREAAPLGARVVHVSTDYVFDGTADAPYGAGAAPRPLGAYGHSKLAGELRLQELLPLDSVIVRSAWLYSGSGGNFVTTMLRLMGERDSLRVVDDQIGAPTWARGLAGAMWAMLERPAAHGVYHWTDAGSCSRHQFALEIQRLARRARLLDREVPVEPVPTAQYPAAARRPRYSVLDCRSSRQLLGVAPAPWQAQLGRMLAELPRDG